MKQQPLLGFLFALITAMAWGSLPIALKQVLSVMTPQTIVWYRFIVAFLALFILLAVRVRGTVHSWKQSVRCGSARYRCSPPPEFCR